MHADLLEEEVDDIADIELKEISNGKLQISALPLGSLPEIFELGGNK